MPVFEIRDKSIDEAELNRKIEENLRERQSGSFATLTAAHGLQSGLASSVQDIEIRDGLGFLRKLARELPDYKVFGPFKTLRRFVKRQIAIDKAIIYFMHTVTNRLSFLADRLESLHKGVGDSGVINPRVREPGASGLMSGGPAPSEPPAQVANEPEGRTPAVQDGANAVIAKEQSAEKDVTDYFYFKFNSAYGGSEEEIRKKGLAYIEFLKGAGTVLDIGCGRGFLMGLLRENGIHVVGIDSNKYMVAACLKKGLDVQCVDMIAYLNQQPDNRFGGIVASHVIEHISGDDLIRFIRACYEKLAPGGTVVFETPNPSSMFVLDGSFHLDITHIRPVHPDFLKLLLDTLGFEVIRTLPVWPYPEEAKFRLLSGKDKFAQIMNTNIEKLNNLFYSHYNYAVVARK